MSPLFWLVGATLLVCVSAGIDLSPPPLNIACSTCRTNTSLTFKWTHVDHGVESYELEYMYWAEHDKLNGESGEVCAANSPCADDKWHKYQFSSWNDQRTKQLPVIQPTIGCSVYNKLECTGDHAADLTSSTLYVFRVRACTASDCGAYSSVLTVSTGQNAKDMPQQTSTFCSVIGACHGVVPHLALTGQQALLHMENELDTKTLTNFFHQNSGKALTAVASKPPGDWVFALSKVPHFKTQLQYATPNRKSLVWMEDVVDDGRIAFTSIAASTAVGQDRKWSMMSGQGSGMYSQKFVIEKSDSPPETWASLSQADQRYITGIATDDQEWLVIASRGVCDLPAKCDQKFVKSTDGQYPASEVDALYAVGYRVTVMGSKGKTWWVAMMTNTGLSDQVTMQNTAAYPSSSELAGWQQKGYRITATAGSTTGWVTVLSKVSTFGEPCLKECHNGGELDDTTCTCKCPQPWFGDTALGGKRGKGCHLKPEPCVLGVFNEYGECPVECGGDNKRRNRTVIRPAMYGGTSCEIVNCKMNQKLFVEPAEEPEPESYRFEFYLKNESSAPADAITLYKSQGLAAVHAHLELGTWFTQYLTWLTNFANTTYCDGLDTSQGRPSWDFSYLDFKHPLRCGTKGCNGAPVVKALVNSTHLYRFRRGRGVDFEEEPGDMSKYTLPGVTHPIYRQDIKSDLAAVWTKCGSDSGCWVKEPYSLLKRETLLQIQRPETSVVVDATSSFDEKDPQTILSIEVTGNGVSGEIRMEGGLDIAPNEGFRITDSACSSLNGNFVVKSISGDASIIQYDIPEEMGLLDMSCGGGGQATPTIQIPLDTAFTVSWSISGFADDLDIVPVVGGKKRYLWKSSRVGAEFLDVTEEFVKDRLSEDRISQIGNGDYDTGMILALRLVKIVEFKDVELFGTFEISVDIQDLGTATEKPQTGNVKIPLVVNNCEPPEVRLSWDPSVRVNPSDKTTFKGTVWFYGMGDMRRAPNATRQMWEANKQSLSLKWGSVEAPGMHVLKETPEMKWNGTFLTQGFKQLQTLEGLQLSNFIIRKRSMDPGFYTFRFGAWDLCSAGRPPIYTEITVEVNTPPEGGQLLIGPSRHVTVFNESIDMLMPGWNDTELDIPLTYYYKYMLNEGHGFKTSQKVECDIEDLDEETMCEEVPVSAQPPSLFHNATAKFPAGEVIVVGYIVDSNGASTRWIWLEDKEIANVSIWSPPMNSSEKMAALKAQADALLESGNSTADPDAALASMNAIVGLLNDANATKLCCGGHGNCTLEPDGCDYVNDILCAVTACSCEEHWQGDTCETPSGELLKQKQAMRDKMMKGMEGAANGTVNSNSTNNTAGAAEGMSKTLQKTTSGAGEMSGNATAGATAMVDSLVAAGSDPSINLSPDCGGPAMGAISNLIDAAMSGGSAGGTGDSLADTLNLLGSALMNSNVPGEKSISIATGGIQMSVQPQTLDGLSGLKFEVVPANNCSAGPQFEFPLSLLGHDVDTSEQMALIGQKWEKNRYGAGNVTENATDLGPSPSPWFGDVENLFSPSPSEMNATENATASGKSKKKVPRGLSAMGLNERIHGLQYGSHIAFTMPLSPPFPGGLRASKCQYMEKSTNKFSQDGTFAIGMTRVKRCGVWHYQMLCATSHLTDFKPEVEDAVPEMNTPDPVGDAGAVMNYSADSIHVPIILGVLTMLNFAGIYYGVKNDRKDKEKYEAYMRIEYLKKGILSGDINENASFVDMCIQSIRATHKILSFIKPPISNAVIFRRYERVACTYAHFLSSLAVCSLFYGKDPDSMPKKISKSIITSILMFPTSSAFPNSFMNIHSLKSKTFRKDDQVLDYADVLELADERLPDDFVKSGVGRDPHQERKARKAAEKKRAAELKKIQDEMHDSEFGVLGGAAGKAAKANQVAPEPEKKKLTWDSSSEEEGSGSEESESESEDEVLKAQTPLMARIALAKAKKKGGVGSRPGAAHAMMLAAARKKHNGGKKVDASDHIHARKLLELKKIHEKNGNGNATAVQKAAVKGVDDPNAPPPTKDNMDEYELGKYKLIVAKYTEEEILEELARRKIRPKKLFAKKIRLMEQLKNATVDETRLTPDEIREVMDEMNQMSQDDLVAQLRIAKVKPECKLVPKKELLQQLMKAIDCVNLEDEKLREELKSIDDEVELLKIVQERGLEPRTNLAPKEELIKQLEEAIDSSALPEGITVETEKQRMSKLSQIKARLELEEKGISPKRVPGTAKDYKKQLLDHMNGVDETAAELRACVAKWGVPRLVKELKSRGVEPAIEIATKKSLCEQLLQVRVREEMDVNEKKKETKAVKKMTLVELIANLEAQGVEPENVTAKTSVLKDQMNDVLDGGYEKDLEDSPEHSEKRIKRMTLRQVEQAILDRGGTIEYADAKKKVVHQQLYDSTDWKSMDEASVKARVKLIKGMDILELKYELKKKGIIAKRVLPKRTELVTTLDQLIKTERYRRKMARKSTLVTKLDPADIDTTLVDPIDIEYEMDLLEEIGEVAREEKCPVRCHSMAKKEDMRWLLLVRRMEFELYIGMGSEKKVQFYCICVALTAFCLFTIYMNLLFGILFEPDQSLGWMTSCLTTLIQGAVLYEPIGICAGVLMGSKLPQLWKLLNSHGDKVDKELDAAILVQTNWRAKKEHRKYMAMLKDKRGAQQAMADARQAEIDKFANKHKREIEAATTIQAFMRGCWDRERCVTIRREILARRARVRKERRQRVMSRIKGQAAASYNMSLSDKRADEERRRLEREAYMAAIIAKKDAARDFLAMKVAEGRMVAESQDAMLENFKLGMGGGSGKKKGGLGGRRNRGNGPAGPGTGSRRTAKTKKIKF